MKQKMALLFFLAALALTACSSDPQWADPEAHEKTVQLNEQYGPLMVGTWHYEKIGERHRYFERLTFKDDGTLTGYRKWQQRELVTIDGEQRYTDWEDVELSGTFTGTWQLRYWSPEGNSGEKRNCLQLTATYDDAGRDYMAYSCALTFAYADATTLRIQGYYVKAPDGWINYQRGPSEPSF
jgi:opacity protein-like surface antigen